VLVTEPPPPEIKVERPPEPKVEPPKPKPPKPKPVKLVEPKPVQVAVTAPAETPPDSAPARFDTGLSSMTQLADASPAAPLVSTEKVPQEAEVPVINNPRFRRTPTPPPYPRRAKEMDQQGVVIVRALISPDGTMGQVVIWKSSGYSMLDDSAKRAVEGWAFEPARVNGRAIEAWVELPVNFRLH
jgi:protein TonB